ncbi:MAG: vanadium-dependent haloperoxidase [Saprospiraceae bacterium]|nr:vanadium-dependent haloperoxidase [Saprospiraceae bacterium]
MKGLLKFLFLLSLLTLVMCQADESYRQRVADPTYLDSTLSKLTDIIVYDIFSPPVASRIYAYSSIAGYETLRHGHPDYPTLAGKVSELTVIPPSSSALVNYDIAGVYAFAYVGRTLIFSEPQMDEYLERLSEKYKDSGVPQKVLEASMQYGMEAKNHIMEWAKNDHYGETRTFPKFDIRDEEGRWLPTPPDYMEGIEPHWRQIRTLLIDSAQQFTPPVPSKFDIKEGSPFYKEVMQVYETGKTLDEEKTGIAQFWDCNPYVSHHTGHVMFATKKITPGGHWMGIAQLATKIDSADIMKTAKTYAYTSMALFDAFISSWDEKYRSNLIRPETVINKYIDENWTPLLQTPPFPEYTSGHSVISSAAAVALTSIYGDHFKFDDTVEMAYGLPMRSFNSFLEASSEAAISRLYGGIHYMPAIENGVAQGRKLGAFVVEKLKGGNG